MGTGTGTATGTGTGTGTEMDLRGSTTIATGVSVSSKGGAADIYATKTAAETEARRAKLAQLYQRLDEITSPPKD